MLDAVIASACRTPIGTLGGGLAELEGHQLGAKVLAESLSRAGLKLEEVDEVIMGQVLIGGAGQNPARQAAIAAGLSHEVVALSVNQVCGSGLRAVGLAARAVSAADARIILAGGQESMSRARHCTYFRSGSKMGHAELIDSMIQDGLWDAFHDYHMGITAENVARQWGITRDHQDAFALASQEKAAAALTAGRFDEEIVPVVIKTRKGDVIRAADEHPRPETKAEDLVKLRPAFDRQAGTVTAGNASGINDGAAALVIMSAEEAARRKIEPLARIVSVVSRGVPPEIMGSGPIPASRAALKQANWSIDSLDLIEANEAFAAQACAVNQELGWDPEKVNVNGGAIALGHPIGASGARILVTLLFEMKRRGSKRGLATLCIGGGMGIAMCVER